MSPDIADEMVSKSLKPFYLFIKINNAGRKALVSLLDGQDNMCLNRAILNHEGRDTLNEAYENTVIKGFHFPCRLPHYLETGTKKAAEYVFPGLALAEAKGINAQNFTLKMIPTVPEKEHMMRLLERGCKTMALVVCENTAGSIDLGPLERSEDFGDISPLIHAACIDFYPELLRALCRNHLWM